MDSLPPLPPEDSNVVSLSERRTRSNRATTQEGKTGPTRLSELEADMSKVLDVLLDLEIALKEQQGLMSRLLHRLQKEREREKT